MAFNTIDYRDQLRALLPRGAAWARETTANLVLLLYGIAEEFSRLHLRSDNLTVEIDPRTTAQLLVDWERVTGLPGHCDQLAETQELRRLDVVSKLTAMAGQTEQYLIDLADKKGYEITIDTFDPFQIGSSVGDPLYGEEWQFAFKVNSALNTIIDFEVGTGAVGEPLRSWGNDRLECLINEFKPAHTVVIYAYS